MAKAAIMENTKGTIAIIGDSIINGIMEGKFCGKGRNVKVRHFPGSNVDDMNHHIVPILRKKPSHLIFMWEQMMHHRQHREKF